jgi:hypothetical protein
MTFFVFTWRCARWKRRAMAGADCGEGKNTYCDTVIAVLPVFNDLYGMI